MNREVVFALPLLASMLMLGVGGAVVMAGGLTHGTKQDAPTPRLIDASTQPQAQPQAKPKPIPPPEYILPLRVHLVASTVTELDGANATDEAAIRRRFERINEAWLPAGIVWQVETVPVDTLLDTSLYEAARGQKDPKLTGPALASIAGSGQFLAPNGWDLFVVRTTSKLGFDGSYKCQLKHQTSGAAFISAESTRDKPLASRKWAHELGHSMGLDHTPCEPKYADRLMMSGRCEFAKRGRHGLSADEINQIKRQAGLGRPVACD
jgi:hypothetical protein